MLQVVIDRVVSSSETLLQSFCVVTNIFLYVELDMGLMPPNAKKGNTFLFDIFGILAWSVEQFRCLFPVAAICTVREHGGHSTSFFDDSFSFSSAELAEFSVEI